MDAYDKIERLTNIKFAILEMLDEIEGMDVLDQLDRDYWFSAIEIAVGRADGCPVTIDGCIASLEDEEEVEAA